MLRPIPILLAFILVVAACADDDGEAARGSETTESGASASQTDASDQPPPETTSTVTSAPRSDALAVTSNEPFPDARCAANEAAGTIGYFTGFDYAAAASILEVLVAERAGYFDELCLDVEITPSFSTANYALVAGNEAQFAASGSFSELVTQAEANDADLVALSVDGYVAIDVLMVKPDRATSLDELGGEAIGIKGALPPAIAVMLAQEAGMTEGDDFQTALLDGFDPLAHWAIDEIAALPGWRSNEPGVLDRAGETFDLYDPGDFAVPGSFGLIYTNRDFLETHPMAAEDFMRATFRGLADALADPEGATADAFELVEANDNPNFLTAEGEAFRWTTDAATIVSSLPNDSFPGIPIGELLDSQVAVYDAVGVYPDGAPLTEARYDENLAADLYDNQGEIIWPASAGR